MAFRGLKTHALCGSCGTTEVVRCYKARPEASFSAA
jgi:predicted RNA-binding Zn-ribbon protein involved in translation (DUF1610 family)